MSKVKHATAGIHSFHLAFPALFLNPCYQRNHISLTAKEYHFIRSPIVSNGPQC